MQQRSNPDFGGTLKALSYKLITLAVLAAGVSLFAQSQAPSVQTGQSTLESQKGITGFESFQGTINSDSRIYKIDSNLGWDFNRHFGIFAGLPFYFANVPSTTTTNGTTTTTTASSTNKGIGNAYMGFVMRAANPSLSYAGAVTVSAPTGSTSNGFSTGRAGVDWTNHLARSFNHFTPFFEGGLSNTVPDSSFSTRPFTSLGGISHLEEGAEYQLVKHLYVGGSGYQIVPFGSQKVFSKISGQGSGKNAFDTSKASTGNDLTRENGFNTWVAIEPSSIVRLEVGFTRSMTFDLSSFAFNLRMNTGKLLRSRHNY
jgi:hypothetical protein